VLRRFGSFVAGLGPVCGFFYGGWDIGRSWNDCWLVSTNIINGFPHAIEARVGQYKEHVGRLKLCNALDTEVDASGLKLSLIFNLESKRSGGE